MNFMKEQFHKGTCQLFTPLHEYWWVGWQRKPEVVQGGVILLRLSGSRFRKLRYRRSGVSQGRRTAEGPVPSPALYQLSS